MLRGNYPARLEIARSREETEVPLEHLLLLIMIALPITLIVAAGGGIFLAKRALNPIDQISAKARHISATDLSLRLGLPHNNDEGGSGLGLSICEWIAHAHGGKIEVESELGQGTTFKVWLQEEDSNEIPAQYSVSQLKLTEYSVIHTSITNNGSGSTSKITSLVYYRDQVVALMFHNVSSVVSGHGTITPDRFNADLVLLQQKGYVFISRKLPAHIYRINAGAPWISSEGLLAKIGKFSKTTSQRMPNTWLP